MLKEIIFIGNKKNRNENEDDSNDYLSLKNRDKLALKYLELSYQTSNLIEKQSYLKKAYYLNNTRIEIVKNYLNILKNNDVENEEIKKVNNVYNIVNKKCNRDDIINFLDKLTETKTYEEFENILKKKLNEIGDEIDVFNQPFNISYNSDLYYISFIIKFIKNFFNIKKEMLKKIYLNYEKMYQHKIAIIKILIRFLDEEYEYNIDHILFYISSYFKKEEILDIREMFLDDKSQFELKKFKDLLNKKKLETFDYYNLVKKNKIIDLEPCIINNELIFNDQTGTKVKLSDYKNYSYESIIKNLFLRETISYKNMKYSKVLKNHYFKPHLDFLKNLLYNILGSEVINSYLKNYLQNVLNIDEKYYNILYLNYEEIWENIIFLPIFSEAFLALTDKMTLKVYFSCFQMGSKNILLSKEIEKLINVAIFVLIFLHEIVGHFFRIFIRFLTTDEKGKKYSLDSKDEEKKLYEAGFYLEQKLFGKTIDKININESLYILNINNYYCNYNKFNENFKSLINNENNKNNKIKLNDLPDYLKDFLNKLNITNEEEINEKKNIYISLKVSGNSDDISLSFINYGFDTV